MNGNCHLLFGLSVGTALAINLDKIALLLPNITNTPETKALFVLGGALGGILPDIDNPRSYVGKLTVPISSVVAGVSEAFGKSGKYHRGIFHDLGLYLLLLLMSYQGLPAVIGLFMGCISHLYLDMFNPAGIPFLFVKRIRLGNIPSGEAGATVFTWMNVFLVLGIGGYYYFVPI